MHLSSRKSMEFPLSPVMPTTPPMPWHEEAEWRGVLCAVLRPELMGDASLCALEDLSDDELDLRRMRSRFMLGRLEDSRREMRRKLDPAPDSPRPVGVPGHEAVKSSKCLACSNSFSDKKEGRHETIDKSLEKSSKFNRIIMICFRKFLNLFLSFWIFFRFCKLIIHVCMILMIGSRTRQRAMRSAHQ